MDKERLIKFVYAQRAVMCAASFAAIFTRVKNDNYNECIQRLDHCLVLINHEDMVVPDILQELKEIVELYMKGWPSGRLSDQTEAPMGIR